MNDPTYNFVKGVGWIPIDPSAPKFAYLRDTDGVTWKVTEVKDPIAGMPWDALYSYEDHNMKGFEDYIRLNNESCTPSRWSKWEAGLTRVYDIYFMYERVR